MFDFEYEYKVVVQQMVAKASKASTGWDKISYVFRYAGYSLPP